MNATVSRPTILFTLTHTSADTLDPIRNQAIQPIATAPLSAAMTRSSQDIVPIPLLGAAAKAAAREFDLSASASVSVPAAVTTVAAAGDASLAAAPFSLAAMSRSLASSGETTLTVSPSTISSFAVTCAFKVLSLAAGLVEARFFAAGCALLECFAADLSGGLVSDLPGCVGCWSWIGLPTGPVLTVCAMP